MAEKPDKANDPPTTLRSADPKPSASDLLAAGRDESAAPTSVLSIVNAQPPPYDDAGKGPSPAASTSTRNPFDDAQAAITVRRQLPEELRRQAAGLEPDLATREAEMADCLALGDYTGALAHAERLVDVQPGHPRATHVVGTCRDVLRKMYASRIGALSRIPVLLLSPDELRWLTIDHKAGFMLSLVDGQSSVEAIVDASALPELDALRILSELVQQRILAFR